MKCPRCHSDNADTSRFCAECGSALRGRVPGSAADAQREPPPKPPEEPGARGGHAPSSRGEGIRLHDLEGLPTKTIAMPVKPVSTGELLAGKYRIIDEIGRGGMGIVVRAEDTRLKRTVALKFLSPEYTGDPEARERFIQEARAASALEHPNICTVFEIDETADGRMFTAMACYEGESLRERLRRGKLDHAEALSIALQTARGLAKAHEKGIVHRDIKPGNIFLTDDGQAKILDFGLAKLVSDIRLTRTGATMGTVAYMSPEQAQGKPVDARTDVWSLGIMLYEMLTGELPFGGENEGSLIHAIIYRPARPLRKADPAIPAEIERVVLKALEKNPADRYQTMADFLADLEALAEGLKPLKAKAGLLRGRVLGIRKPVFLAASAAVLITAVLGLLALLSGPGRAEVFDSVAILPIINETGDTNKDYFANSLTRQLNAELYKVAALTVPPAESIMTFKGTDKPPKKIAEELGVRAVVQVSWLQVGSKHRLIYTLSDPYRNKVIAADTLEREGEDILFLQSEFARAVVAAVKVAVTPTEQTLLAGGRKVNPEAYSLLMRGIEGYRSGDEQPLSIEQSYELASKAVEIDPDFALAHAWVAYFSAELIGGMEQNEKTVFPRAWAAVEKSIEIDNSLAEAHSTRGVLRIIGHWDFAQAEQDFHTAMDLAPGDKWIPLVYEAFYLSMIGRADEAILSLERRRAKQNIIGLEHTYIIQQIKHYLWARKYGEATEELKKLPSTHHAELYFRGLAKALTGAPLEALALFEKLKGHPLYQTLWGDRPWFKRDRAWILAFAGRRKEALELLEEHIAIQARRGIDTSFDEACVYAGLGDKDRAFELLNKSYENHSSHILWLVPDWPLHSLHGDPRFEELVRKIGFPVIPGPKKN